MKNETMDTEEKYNLARWMSGEMDKDELQAFRLSAEYQDYERIARVSRELDPGDFDHNAMLASVLSRRKTAAPKVVRMRKPVLLSIAAMLIAALGLFFLLRPEPLVNEQAAFGKTASVNLPDGSEVVLNSGSEIAYVRSDWENERVLSLNGEAYFKVAKGKTFAVRTELGTVTVVGTQFNVRARGARLEVECYEGRVAVTSNGTNKLLTPGMRIAIANGIAGELPLSDRTQPAWTQGEMQFVSAPLTEVIAEIERRFDVRIELRPGTSETVTGTFSSTDLSQTIETLCMLYKLNAQTRNNVVILSADE